MKKTLLILGISAMFLLVGLSAGATTPASTETTNTIKIGFPQPFPPGLTPLAKLWLALGVFSFEASGKGTYDGPLGHLDYVNINYHFTDPNAQTIGHEYWIIPRYIPRLYHGPGEHIGSLCCVYGEASQDADGTYHIEGKFLGGAWLW